MSRKFSVSNEVMMTDVWNF